MKEERRGGAEVLEACGERKNRGRIRMGEKEDLLYL
jgi:hypothetical protein